MPWQAEPTDPRRLRKSLTWTRGFEDEVNDLMCLLGWTKARDCVALIVAYVPNLWNVHPSFLYSALETHLYNCRYRRRFLRNHFLNLVRQLESRSQGVARIGVDGNVYVIVYLGFDQRWHAQMHDGPVRVKKGDSCLQRPDSAPFWFTSHEWARHWRWLGKETDVPCSCCPQAQNPIS